MSMVDEASILPRYAQAMARYNTWQNRSIYECAGRLSDAERGADRGAFFGSILATLNHVLWADQMWLMRFGAAERPAARTIAQGLVQFADWLALEAERHRFDGIIERWAESLQPEDLRGNLSWYSTSAGREMTTPRAVAALQLFNHQTHHRGQVHAMLTGYGLKPGVTDLPFAPML